MGLLLHKFIAYWHIFLAFTENILIFNKPKKFKMNALIKRLLHSKYFILTLVPLYLLAFFGDRAYRNYIFLLLFIILIAVTIYRIRTGYEKYKPINRIIGAIAVILVLYFFYHLNRY